MLCTVWILMVPAKYEYVMNNSKYLNTHSINNLLIMVLEGPFSCCMATIS